MGTSQVGTTYHSTRALAKAQLQPAQVLRYNPSKAVMVITALEVAQDLKVPPQQVHVAYNSLGQQEPWKFHLHMHTHSSA